MSLTIAVDGMGGDFGPEITVPAALSFVQKHQDAKVILVGQEEKMRPYLKVLHPRLSLHHASEVVEMDESPA